MDFADNPEEAAFRAEVRKFLKDELPEGLARKGGGGAMFGGGGRSRSPDYFQKLMPWLNKLGERGWIAPAWPTEYGGAGLTVIEQFILNRIQDALAAFPRVLRIERAHEKRYLPAVRQGFEEVLAEGLARRVVIGADIGQSF